MGSIDRVKPKSQKATTENVNSITEQSTENIVYHQATTSFLPEFTQVTETFTLAHPIVYNAKIEEYTSTLHTL